MNFTREPIIETIITPKEGYKLLVRNSKGGVQEEFSVDAVEVVSFGHSFFFRSQEKPKSFLVPVSDYEVIEIKEARVVLKAAGPERAIKIGGGREQPKQREPVEEEAIVTEETTEVRTESRPDKKRDRHRRRRRRGEERFRQGEPTTPAAEGAEQGGGAQKDETPVSSSTFSTLIPPPTTLISQTLGSRYKEKDAESAEGHVPPKSVEHRKEPPQDSGESFTLERISHFTYNL